MPGFEFTVGLMEIANEFNLEVLSPTDDVEKRVVATADVMRPGLQLASGYFEHFDNERLLLFGIVEISYLQTLPVKERVKRLDMLFSKKSPALIITRGLETVPEVIESAKRNNIPVFRTESTTSTFMAALIASLNIHLAPRISRHGVLVEVYGEGILLLGESGVGKSETAIELLKRGHRLVADDAVDIKKVSSKTLIGSSPKVIRHFVEIRGIGIVDVKEIFGMGAVKDVEKIDLILNIEPWQEGKEYERLGLENQYTNILGIDVPSIVVPVKPGRNLAVIVEVAAMNHRQKNMGYSAVESLNQRLLKEFGKD